MNASDASRRLLHFKSMTQSGSGIVLDYDEGWAKVTAYDEGIIRVQAGLSGTQPGDEGYAIEKREWRSVELVCADSGGEIKLSTRDLRVVIDRSPFGVRFVDQTDKYLTGGVPSWSTDYSTSRNSSGEDEHFFGFGLQFHRLDHRGMYRTIKTNADPPNDNGMAHAPDPFFFSTRGYAIFLNGFGYSQFDMCATKPDEYTFSAPEPTLDYFFIYGPSFREIADRQTWLRGRTQMPPKWGLGFWYRMPSEWHADTTVESAKEFRKRHIPCDVIGLEPKWQTHTYPCTYVWNKDFYPDPAGYVKWMRENGFHVNLWEHEWVHPDAPIRKELEENNLVADKLAMGGAIPDFTIKKARDVFADLHKALHIDVGVDGYKLDECDGSDFTGNWFYPDDTLFPSGLTGAQMHNLTGFLYNQTFQDMFTKLGLRTYLLLRANCAGGQRYASCIYSDYYAFGQYIRAQATSGFSGFLWCPELREAKSDDEFMRRAENMFFAPMAMINAWAGDKSLLPWGRGESCEEGFRKYAQLRMRLLPYIYSSFWKTHTVGLSFVRALVMDYPDDKATYGVDNEFMFGESMLIAPLQDGTSRSIYLPEGTWTDFWTDKTYEGGATLTYEAALDVLPIFVKAGAVIPMGHVTQHAGEKPIDEIELHIYPGEGSFTFYDDDGVTTNYLSGDHVEVRIQVAKSSVKIGMPEGSYVPEVKTFLVKIRSAGAKEVRVPFGQEQEISF